MSHPTWLNTPGSPANFHGSNRALTLDEQLEIQRQMRQATSGRRNLAVSLATAYGVSTRTIWRYYRTLPVPPSTEVLRVRLAAWARERSIPLTNDDLLSLLIVVVRHRDMNPTKP